jgi:hypothetical protein
VISRPSSAALAWTASTSTSPAPTEIPGAAGSSLPVIVTWTVGLVGEARGHHPTQVHRHLEAEEVDEERFGLSGLI